MYADDVNVRLRMIRKGIAVGFVLVAILLLLIFVLLALKTPELNVPCFIMILLTLGFSACIFIDARKLWY
ncbi:MAG: hypothetical protein WC178_05225 [Candidatus Paceibacterota bacterium]|jgi:hypothetical protein